jgi:cytochrome c oxidase subunit II
MNSNYGWGLPVQASTIAKDIDSGIYVIHGLMFAIFILWGIFFTCLLIRYRQKEGVPAERHEEKGLLSGLWPDITVMALEILLIVFYAIPGWNRIKLNFPKPEDSNHVAVIAEQFGWNVQYPGPDGKLGRRDPKLVHFTNTIGLDRTDPAAKDDVVISNELYMPLGKPTLIELSSKDVIHSFSIPEFRIKQDAVPGMNIEVWVEPTMTGHFELGCAQLCGVGHSFMRGDVYVQTPQEFANWLSSQQSKTSTAQTTPKPTEAW